MRAYSIQVMIGTNSQTYIVKASAARVAVQRALDRYTDSQLAGAVITVQRGKELEYVYRYYADVPTDPPGSRKRQSVSEVMTREQAIDGLTVFVEAHPEYNFVAIQRVEV